MADNVDQSMTDALPLPTVAGAASSSTSDLSSAPLSSVPSDQPTVEAPVAPTSGPTQQYSAQTEEIVKRINTNAANAAAAGTPGWEAAREQIMRDYPTAEKLATPDPAREQSVPKRGSVAPTPIVTGNGGPARLEGDASTATPGSAGRGRGRGRGGRGRGRGGGRGGKRKREEKEDEDGDSDSSEVYTPAATQTKSGRAVQKPTTFVPPPQASPTSGNKRKKPYRRNPESAVCKMCLRGTSPASNMIVFCDGCNTPYHRYCHHPPIDQSVVDEVDKEWYCKQCEKERVVPVPDAEVADFVAASGASVEQRQRYFGSLPSGLLVTLLTKATTMHPELPVFAPDFHARAAAATAQNPPAPNGHAHPAPSPLKQGSINPTFSAPGAAHSAPATTLAPSAMSAGPVASLPDPPVPDEHPLNYVRPGYGLMRTLPPEQEDLQWLVDDDDRYGVFTHMYQVDPQAANPRTGGGRP
ncbi:hypothetical protein LTR10_005792 [Elasticomyces elasticus]|nr:hypothetical protein LTR10_005792 [Elasticomyces elasticus]KAK4965000.1 hypothetical protein LTR42_012417 [Elasticomyces elasticus]